MKRLIISMSLLLCILPITGCNSTKNDNYLRIHIRANSNSEEDQNIKYYAKDLVVAYLSDKLTDCNSKSEAQLVINENIDKMTELINVLLLENGFDYGCNITINNEYFPTRTYDDLTLTADYYDAVIINLGAGSGNNWWCIVYPNMCFKSPTDIVYKSKIAEIINKIKG